MLDCAPWHSTRTLIDPPCDARQPAVLGGLSGSNATIVGSQPVQSLVN